MGGREEWERPSHTHKAVTCENYRLRVKEPVTELWDLGGSWLWWAWRERSWLVAEATQAWPSLLC